MIQTTHKIVPIQNAKCKNYVQMQKLCAKMQRLAMQKGKIF